MNRSKISIEKHPFLMFLGRNNVVETRSGKTPICGDCARTEDKASKIDAFFYYDESKKAVVCGHCGRELKVTKTPQEHEAEDIAKEKAEEERRKALEEKARANLHLEEVGSDWECGFKYYGLSARIDYDDWLKVKKHFRYYRRGWSRGQELEWNYGEPTGWLTRNPKAVEDILVQEGLIKESNTMDAIDERARLQKAKEEAERKAKLQKREELLNEIKTIKSEIDKAFDCDEVRVLDDAEAYKHYFNPTFGKCTILTHTITDSEIIRVRDMGDFKYGMAIPYSEKVENLIVKYDELNKESWNYH